nr:hypothetical protein orf189 [Navicula sp.]WPV72574.1 hypothetical protein orf189 [Navicula sp.]WPV72655.1 hypothetical protein orf189 [Navicula sp.]WPV72732.1 hypothetical protein orf189 [Navicula sp.]
MVNFAVAGYSAKTMTFAFVGFLQTDDQVAKWLYAVSVVLAAAAGGCSGSAFIQEKCFIHRRAALTEAAAETIYWAAEKARATAAAKANHPKRLRKPLFYRNRGDIAFTVPCSLDSKFLAIANSTINNAIFIISVYGYIKITYKVYKRIKPIIDEKLKVRRLKKLNQRKNKNTRRIRQAAYLFTSLSEDI